MQSSFSIGSVLASRTIRHRIGRRRFTSCIFLYRRAETRSRLNENETRDWLSGIQYTAVSIDTTLPKVNRNVIGYLGAYHQWDNNWKLTGRFGVQFFGGAQVLNLVQFQPFTRPVIRLDIDRMDDDDNRLFGISAQVSWTPKPAYQLTIRTPLFAVKNGRKY